jgi:hypothetical protein
MTQPAAWGSAAPDPQPCGQHPGPVAVALGRPLGRALVGSGADHRSELGLDQGLVAGLGGLADAVIHLRGREGVQDLQQRRLVNSHRGLCPFASTIGLVSLTIARCRSAVRSYALAARHLHHSLERHCGPLALI